MTLKTPYSVALRFLALALLAFGYSADAFAQREGETIEIEVGEQTSLSAEGVRSYSATGEEFADVRLTRDQSRFVIVGLRAGNASVLLILRDGTSIQRRIIVSDPNAEDPDDPAAVNVRENVRLDLYFVQVSDSYSHAIGVAFPSVLGATNQPSTFNLNFAGTRNEPNTLTYNVAGITFLPRIDIAQSNGWARIYRQGVLITANGTSAQFSAGGEVNFVQTSALGAQLITIEFGTSVTCRPRYDADTGRVELQITAEVADITPSIGDGAPGRTVTNINTLVNLELGQSITLAGFVVRSDRRARTGLPGLSQIPVIGALFGSHSREFEESEGLMFVVPSVTDAVPLRRRNRIEEVVRLYNDFRGGVDEIELVDHPTVGGAQE
ncbi:MAG: hypothetical protein AAF411_19545 [Myxococcota bacterium]